MKDRKLCPLWLKKKIKHSNYKTKPLRDASVRRALFPAFVLRASMTVEAALVLPLFIFFMAEILYVFEMIRLESSMLSALHETGTQVSEYAYYLRYGSDALGEILGTQEETAGYSENDGTGQAISSFVISETYIRSKVEKHLGRSLLNNSCLQGGASGISYLNSSVLNGDDIVDITADYRIKPFLPLFGLQNMSAQARYYGHAWVGYSRGSTGENGSKEEDDRAIVYIARTGIVYHKDRNCTYLKPSIRSVQADQLDQERSNDGSKYYACERCKPAKNGTVVIAEEGNRYHSSASCTAIWHDVESISLSEAEKTRRACSKCGG